MNIDNTINVRISPKDDLMLKIISKSGSATLDFLSTTLEYTPKRLNLLVRAGFIKKNNNPGREGRRIVNRFSYSLSDKGIEYCKENEYIKAIVGHDSIEHSNIAANFVYKLLVQDGIGIEYLRNGKELELEFKEEIEIAKAENIQFSVCDLAIMKNNEAVLMYEFETSSYRPQHRTKHYNFAIEVAKVKPENYRVIKKTS